MASDKRRIVIGAALLLISTAVILAIGQIGTALPIVAGTLATLGLAVGALLFGTSGEGRPV